MSGVMRSMYDRLRGALLLAALLAGHSCTGSSGSSNSAPCPTPTGAGGQITQVPLPAPAATQSVLVTDFARQRIVLFGNLGFDGGNTFEWDGTHWIDCRPAHSPSLGLAMAADPARGEVLLFGAGSGSQETWSWNGRDWLMQDPAQRPPARLSHAMAADTVRQRVVLFGGYGPGGFGTYMNDTWEWDGTNWQQRLPALSPPGRAAHAMSFDPLRQRTVMFGGRTSSTPMDTLWEWDGQAWQEISVALRPPARSMHAMVWVPSRQRILLVGGSGSGSAISDAWEWDGTQWSSAPAPPVARVNLGLACEPQGDAVLLFGGGENGDSYRWNGSAWQLVGHAPSAVLAGFAACTDLLRLRTVIHGGSASGYANVADTIEWDGNRWWQVTGSSPGPLFATAMAFDAARGKSVLFGGSERIGPMPSAVRATAETWELDGAGWTRVAVPGPPARFDHEMAWHPSSARVVLFGGRSGFGGSGVKLGDTWTFDGLSWQQEQPAQSPSPRTGHAMATDACRARVVLFGGSDTSDARDDTWEWDGTDWRQALPAAQPPARTRGAMAYDWGRQRVVLHGGYWQPFAAFADCWEWDGTNWLALSLTVGPPVSGHHLAYDVAGARMLVLYGATTSNFGSAVLTSAPAEVSTIGNGCGGTAGPPRLAADAPYLGNLGCALELAGLANAPCLFAVSFGTVSQPLGAGCTRLLAEPLTTESGVTNPSGIAHKVLPIELAPALRGLVLYAQASVLDASAPLGFGMTAGLRLVVGD